MRLDNPSFSLAPKGTQKINAKTVQKFQVTFKKTEGYPVSGKLCLAAKGLQPWVYYLNGTDEEPVDAGKKK